jgi:hypothetical protein
MVKSVVTELIKEKVEPMPEEVLKELAPKVKVIYTDVDGTLLGPKGCLFLTADNQLTLVPAQAIISCHLNHFDVVLISGRRSKQLHGDARIFGFNNWIAEMGCQIVYRLGEVTILNIGDFEVSEGNVWQTIKASGAPKLLLNHYARRLEYHTPWSEGRECSHVFRGLIDVQEANELLRSEGYLNLKVVDNGVIHRTSPQLSADLPEIHAYHLLPKASSKASAVRKDRELRGIPKEATIAIGDAESDLELAPEVGALFLVRNALTDYSKLAEKIKAYSNVFVTRELMGLGWAEVINMILGRK